MTSVAVLPDLTKTSLTPAEREALARILARLHEIFAAGGLRSVILYGSKARGTSHAHSDVDLLIVHDDQITSEQKDRLYSIFWETDFNFADLATNFQLWFKPHAEISEWEEIGEPVAQNIQREGIVLEGEPVHVKKIEKTRLAHTEMVSARNALAATEHLLNGGFYADSISKAYYVYLYVARAALVAQGITPQSHSGTNKMFGLYLVKPGMVPEKFGHLFGKMEQDRVEADYKHEYVFTREDAERAIERARELLAIIEDLVPRLLNE